MRNELFHAFSWVPSRKIGIAGQKAISLPSRLPGHPAARRVATGGRWPLVGRQSLLLAACCQPDRATIRPPVGRSPASAVCGPAGWPAGGRPPGQEGGGATGQMGKRPAENKYEYFTKLVLKHVWTKCVALWDRNTNNMFTLVSTFAVHSTFSDRRSPTLPLTAIHMFTYCLSCFSML